MLKQIILSQAFACLSILGVFGCSSPPTKTTPTISTEIPFELIDNRIFIDVKLDGHGLFKFVLDTGWDRSAITPEVAKKIKFSESNPKIAEVEIQNTRLEQVQFEVDDLSRVQAAMGFRRFEGVIGYDFFNQWVVEINYEKKILTLFTPSTFRYQGKGAVVPISLNDRHIPIVEAEVDGRSGSFWVDSGDRSSLTFMTPFVQENHLVESYHPSIKTVTGCGVAGPLPAYITRARQLRLGGFDLQNNVIRFPTEKGGLFDVPRYMGSIGTGVLKRFNVVVDYPKNEMIFEKNSHFSDPDLYDRVGMWFIESKKSFLVLDVIPDSPTWESGIRNGDSIVSINGKTTNKLFIPDLRNEWKSTALADVTVRYRSRGLLKATVIHPRELLP